MADDIPSPVFDEKGLDRQTFAPFVLDNWLDTKWNHVRLFFDDATWLNRKYGTDSIAGYYLNGYGIQGLVEAALIAANIQVPPDRIKFDSEADTCNIYFKDLDVAVKAAQVAASMIQDRNRIEKMIEVAREHGLED